MSYFYLTMLADFVLAECFPVIFGYLFDSHLAMTMVRGKPLRNGGKYSQTHTPYKKNRNGPTPSRTIMTRSQCSTSCTSFFSRIPAEVFDMILDKLSGEFHLLFCTCNTVPQFIYNRSSVIL